MMISPESYYELYLKNKNEDELRLEIKKLKRKINSLKRMIEDPSYISMVKPDESTQIYCMNLYLEKAKEALNDLGVAYKPTKAEQRIEAFNRNIPFIKEINFRMGEYFGGSTYYTIKFEEDYFKISMKDRFSDKSLLERTFEDKAECYEKLQALNLGEWRSTYDTYKYGYSVCDGTQWELEIYFSNGLKAKKFYGDNAYPYNFDELLGLFGLDDDEEEMESTYTIDSEVKDELLHRMVQKIKEIPLNTEITTFELLELISKESSYSNGNYVFDGVILEISDIMGIDYEFRSSVYKHGIEIDDTIHAGEVLGMPFHIGFLLKNFKI